MGRRAVAVQRAPEGEDKTDRGFAVVHAVYPKMTEGPGGNPGLLSNDKITN
jgi:hypothetical protein